MQKKTCQTVFFLLSLKSNGEIESLKEYIGIILEENFMELATKIYRITDFICDDYPKYKECFLLNNYRGL